MAIAEPNSPNDLQADAQAGVQTGVQTGVQADPETRAPGPAPAQRAHALNRLQVGGLGLGFILLVVGIANVVIDRAQEVEETAVPEAKLATPDADDTPASDPLAEIGVVPSPEPATPTPTTSSTASDVPSAPPRK